MKLEKTNTQLTDTEIERIIQLSNDHNNLTSTALVAIIKLEKTSPKLSETEIERIIQLSNDHNNLTSTALVTIIKLEKTKPQLSETAIIGIIKSLNKTNYYIKLSFIVGLHIGVIISQLFALNLILTTLSTAILTSTLTSMIYKGLKNEQFYKLVFQPLAFSAFVNLFLFFILTTNPVLSSLITSKSLLVTTMLMISSLSLTLSKNLYSRYNKSFSENLKYSLWNNRLKPLLKQLYNLFYLKFINLFCNTALLLASTFFILLLLTFPLIAFLILCIQQFICYIMFTILAMIFNITYYIAIPSLAFIYFSQIIYSYDKIFNIFKEYCNFIENHISIKLETITISFICILSIASYVINPTKSFNILIQNIYLCFANPLLLTTIIITSLLISLCIENYKNNKNNDSIIEKLITSILNTLDLLLCTISCPILLLTPLFLQQTLFYIICAIRSLLFGSKSFEIYDKDLSTTDIENHLPNYLKTTHTELSNTFNLSEQKAPEAMA